MKRFLSHEGIAFNFHRCLYTSQHQKRDRKIKPIEMVPIYGGGAHESDRMVTLNQDESENAGDASEEPLGEGLQNTLSLTPYRVSWYVHTNVTPAKKFLYWAYRRLKELPQEWQEYYRRMLYQEVSAARYVNQTWDCFMMVVDGYRKGKWVLRKYGVEINEDLIPKPYNNFWEETTHEERVWAHRRSHQLKELQALQRDEDELIFGAHSMDRREVSYNSLKNIQSGMQGGTPVHAHDMPAPSEGDVKMSRFHEEMSSALMSSIEDDKLWNPVLRSRIQTQNQRDQVDLYAFEDEEEFKNHKNFFDQR